MNAAAPLAPIPRVTTPRLRALLRDVTELLGQQMYFWGRDVIHPQGNLLCKHGFARKKSEGLEGTSCYRKSLPGDRFIELHGACAGCYAQKSHVEGESNFLYIRARNRCFLYAETAPPAPGFYEKASLLCGPATQLYAGLLPFLDWWIDYETWVSEQTAAGWRASCYEAYGSLPASKPSLPPSEATSWLHDFRESTEDIDRLRERKRALRM